MKVKTTDIVAKGTVTGSAASHWNANKIRSVLTFIKVFINE